MICSFRGRNQLGQVLHEVITRSDLQFQYSSGRPLHFTTQSSLLRRPKYTAKARFAGFSDDPRSEARSVCYNPHFGSQSYGVSSSLVPRIDTILINSYERVLDRQYGSMG
ncbi:hypothetical protein RSAG8_08895, partial [Rhizoctonia solani AG-8 WAC10335]